jgi:glutamate racemase
MLKSSQPIGIFDSGVGGLTVLKELRRILPEEDLIYLGDTARVPYGTRSPKTVIRYSERNAEFLVKMGIKLLVVACNTSSSVSLEVLRSKNAIPVIGVIEPGAKKALELTKNGIIGVIGTEATIRSQAYQETIKRLAQGQKVQVIGQACPLLVPLVEEGWIDDPITKEVTRRYLSPLLEKGIDVLVLGCTHYPLLEKVIMEVVGPSVTLINSAKETAEEVKKVLEALNLKRERGIGKTTFYVTDNPEKFRHLGELFLGERPEEVEEIDL